MEFGEQLQHQQEYFTKYAQGYDKAVSERLGYTPVKQALLRILKKRGNFNQDAKLLDIACGTGKLLELAKEELSLKPEQLFGIDLTPAMIDVAKNKPEIRGASLVVGRVEEMPFRDGEFDLITTTFSFHHFASAKSMAEIKRVLKPGGILAIGDLCPPPPLSPKIFDKLLSLSGCGVGGYRNQAEISRFLTQNGFQPFYQNRVKGLVLLTLASKLDL